MKKTINSKKTSRTVKKTVSIPAKLPGNTAVALPKTKRTPALPIEPRGLALPKPHTFQKWFPYFITGIIIIIAIVGAILYDRAFQSESALPTVSNQGNRATLNASIEPVTIWEYRYTWAGTELSQDVPSLASYSFINPEVTSELFKVIKNSLGIESDARTTEYSDGLILFEAGIELPEQDILGLTEGDEIIDDSILSSPDAYQLTSYSNFPVYWYGLISSAQWMSEHDTLPTEDQAKQLANEFLQSRGLLPDDADGPFLRGSSTLTDSGLIADDEIGSQGFISLYYQKMINDLPVVDEAGDPIPYVTVDIAGDNKVISVSGPIRPNYQLTEIGNSDKTQSQAWQEITDDLWGPASLSSSSVATGQQEKIITRGLNMATIDPVYLSVTSFTDPSISYFEPAFRFLGELSQADGTVAYPINIVVPAVSDSNYDINGDISYDESDDSVLPF